MYHYILQVYPEPHKEDDWAAEEDFIDRPDLIPIADHVKTVCDRNSAIRHFEQWFHAHHMGTFSGGSFVLAPNARSHYFAGRFPEFLRNLKALEAVSETQYINDHDYVENCSPTWFPVFPNAVTATSWNLTVRRSRSTVSSGLQRPVCLIISALS